MSKRCPRCGQEKAASEFGWRDAARTRLRAYCRPCFRAAWREWYRREPNRRRYSAQAGRRKSRLTRQNRELVRALKAQPCTDCGRTFPPYVMDFDHVGEKTAEVSALTTYGAARLLREIANCEVVCANCHRARTWLRLHASRPGHNSRAEAGPSPTLRDEPGVGDLESPGGM